MHLKMFVILLIHIFFLFNLFFFLCKNVEPTLRNANISYFL